MILKFNKKKIEDEFEKNDEFYTRFNAKTIHAKINEKINDEEYESYYVKSVEMQIFLETMHKYINKDIELTANTEINRNDLFQIIKNNYYDIKNNIICKSAGKLIEKIFIKHLNVNIQNLTNIALYHYGFRRCYFYSYNFNILQDYINSFTEKNVKIGLVMSILYNSSIHLMMSRILDYIDLLVLNYNNDNDRIIAINMDTIQKKFYSFLKDKNRRANHNYNNIITEFNYFYALNDKKQEIFYIGTYDFITKMLSSFNTQTNINAF